jgi:hypothetical protein
VGREQIQIVEAGATTVAKAKAVVQSAQEGKDFGFFDGAPGVPTLAAAALVRKFQVAEGVAAGARPCIGVLSLADFIRECDGLHIQTTEHRS